MSDAIERPWWAAGIDRDLCVSEQGPGYYRTKLVRGGPFVAVRVMLEGDAWVILKNGEVQRGSGTADPWDCLFYQRGPFTPITAEQYDALLTAIENAPPGSPLRTPDQPVRWREAPAQYRGKP